VGKACQFNLFHFIPFGGNQLWRAKEKAVAGADGLVDVSVDAYFSPAPLIGSLYCTEVRGTTYYLTGAPPPPPPVPVVREALPIPVVAPQPAAEEVVDDSAAPPDDDGEPPQPEAVDSEATAGGDSVPEVGEGTDAEDVEPEPVAEVQEAASVAAEEPADEAPTEDAMSAAPVTGPAAASPTRPDYEVCGDGGNDDALRSEIRAVVEATLRQAGSSSGWIDADPYPRSTEECAAAAVSERVVFAQVRCPAASQDPYTCTWRVAVITPDGTQALDGSKETRARSIKRIRKGVSELLR
jgi:hypothetical protein